MADEPEKMFVADMNGIFAQHAAMWAVYTETVKILVTSTSLPIIAGSVVFSITKDPITFATLPVIIFWTLIVAPILNLLLLGVVIQHRLVILFYARCLNGYRRVYLSEWNSQRSAPPRSPICLPMPTSEAYPRSYELMGPMGLIVHCSGIINGLFAFGAAYRYMTLAASVAVAFAVLLSYELWYAISVKLQGRPAVRARARAGAAQAEPQPPPAPAE
jgi:hypothetical protein